MLLSKKLTFYFVFSVLLVAALAFSVAPAMASGVIVSYEAVTDPAAGATADAGANWVVTFTFRDGTGSFVKDDFITAGDPNVVNVSLGGTAVAGDAFSYGDDNKLTVSIPASDTAAQPQLVFTVTGYAEQTIASPTTDANGDEPGHIDMDPAPGSLRGKGYLVVVKDGAAANLPQLPASVTVGTPVALDGNAVGTTGDEVAVWADMPNLEEFFNVGGGTIDLNVTDTTADSRRLVINEVMWAVDNANIGNDAYTRQQWIEIYNPSSIPILHTAISFSTIPNESGLNPPPAIAAGTADRLSNIPSFTNTWSVKGQNGTTMLNDATPPVIIGANPMFKSMSRAGDHQNTNDGRGHDASNWAASTLLYLPGFVGTPGGANTRGGVPTKREPAAATNPPKDKVIVSEIGLSNVAGHDWIELTNISGSAVNIKKWTISLVTGIANDEVVLYRFRDNDKFPGDNHLQSIPAGGHLLLVFAHPGDTPLSVGIDVLLPDRDQAFGHADHKFLFIGANKNIPSNGEWFIVVRSNHEDKFLKSSHHIQDLAGPGANKTPFDAQYLGEEEVNNSHKDKKGNGDAGGNIWHTKAWPLQNQHLKDDQVLKHTNLPNDNTAWYRRTDKGGGQGWRHESFGNTGWTGAGYDRGVDPGKYKGSPGYPNGSHKGKVGDITDGMVVISELMLTTDNGRYPQWIELYNTSKTNSVNLTADDGWRLVIENHDSGQWVGKRDLIQTISFKSDDVKTIPPNQTVLVVSTTTTRKSSGANVDHFPGHRVYDVYSNNRSAFYMASRRAPFLNTNGFHIKLIDGKGTVSDEIGNLDGNNRTYDAPYSWEWPSDMTEMDERTSLIRLMNEDKTFRKGVPDRDTDGDMTGMVLPMGTKWRGNGMVVKGMDADGNPMMVPAKYAGAAWVHASDTARAKAQDTYYGNRDDHGTPGHTTNTALPVELSHFRPTLENGEVVIRWTTESELNNAGFNILRSDARDGEYKQVNAEMIQGNGTTGERHTYKWVDQTAKPNVVYYYQIEDVSFAGERQTLQTTKLKGLISARGKATTTWGDIKEVQ